jgi:hypothetical protein
MHTPEDLPLNCEAFAGNRVDATTVEDVVRRMEASFGQAKRIWAMDRAMVSEANNDFLLSHEALNIVGSPGADLQYFEAELADAENGNAVQHGLEARAVAHPDRTTTNRMCCAEVRRGAKKKRQ